MGFSAGSGIDACLREGGIVVAASDRAARALRSRYHRSRRTEGLTAWTAPRILDWNSFVSESWSTIASDGRMLLSAAQELTLWEQIAARSQRPATLLNGPRRRVAALAMQAHGLLATHAPRYLAPAARRSWQQDAATFSDWLTEFDTLCLDNSLLSLSRLPLELVAAFEQSSAPRLPLLLAGFDRILPAQRTLLDAWGAWQRAAAGTPASHISNFSAENSQAESAACALWCSQQLIRNPHARLLIVTHDAAARRGEIERALLRHLDPAHHLAFEFSLGVPLAQVPLSRSAFLLLRWLTGPIEEAEADWLFSTERLAASAGEAAALPHLMRELRRRERERTHWTLEALSREQTAQTLMPSAWKQRMLDAQSRLTVESKSDQSPIHWAALIPQLLKLAGWPGHRPLSSFEFQSVDRWQQTLDTCASLGFDGRRIPWREFLFTLAHSLEETLFTPESREAPIQIAGPAESAGLDADAIWFLGADDAAWPAGGSAHPLLPLAVQREGAMPHAAPQLDWELASAITTRLLASAPDVTFSFAVQQESVEARGSRLIAQLAGPPQPLPADLRAAAVASPITLEVEDASLIPFPHSTVGGGANVLTLQSQCPFRAFATFRLGAQSWQPAQAGLTPAQRGKLLHSVMSNIWDGKPDGISSLDDLRTLPDRAGFVADHVRRVLDAEIPAALRERMPRRYLDLERPRLTRLISAWLDYEMTRHSFEVAHTEAKSEARIAGLTLSLRLDRLDRLTDGTVLVIDYKTGDIKTSAWDLPRPDDVQLPLYAAFALDEGREPLGGLAFAKVRPGEHEFAALAFAPGASLLTGLTAAAAARRTLTLEQLAAWRDCIVALASDFVAGRAEVDPKRYPETCANCDLHALCRVDEFRGVTGGDDEDDEGAHND